MRTALYVLCDEYGLESHKLGWTFSQLFGIVGGVAGSSLESQYRDKVRKGRSQVWDDVIRAPNTRAERKARRQLRARINAILPGFGKCSNV